MKKQILAAATAAALIISLSSCGKKDAAVEIVAPNGEQQLRVAVGDEISVAAHTKKSETIKWSCEDGDIAAITADGKLTGIANGITVVTAKTDSGYDHIGLVVGNGAKGTEVITKVVNEDGTVTQTVKKPVNKDSKITDLSISLNGMTEDETLLLRNNDTGKFKVTVSPADCDDPIAFSSSDPAVAEVDADGVVTPKSKGTVTITATAPNGIEDTFKIFVR